MKTNPTGPQSVNLTSVPSIGFFPESRKARTLCLALIAFATLASCTGGPPSVPADAWLSFKFNNGTPGCGSGTGSCNIFDPSEAYNYYCALGVDPGACSANPSLSLTLDQWKVANGFPGAGVASALYGNVQDFLDGRQANCWQSGQSVACYVGNYGPPIFAGSPWPKMRGVLDATFTELATGQAVAPFATEAIVFNPTGIGANSDKIAFLAFGPPDSNGSGTLVPVTALDTQGAKSAPRMCMACHGGIYDSNAHSAKGSSLLPFDVFSFGFGGQRGFGFDDQQESFRNLNRLVLAAANPDSPNNSQAISDLVNGPTGFYGGNVQTPNTVAQDGYVPAGWSANPSLYTGVIRQYCRTCHLAQPATFTTYSEFQGLSELAQSYVCGSLDMPHSEVAFGDFTVQGAGFWWDSVAQIDLGDFFQSQNGGNGNCLKHH